MYAIVEKLENKNTKYENLSQLPISNPHPTPSQW